MTKNLLKIVSVSLMLVTLATSCNNVFNTDDYKIKKIEAAPTLNLPLVSGPLVIQDILSRVDQTNIKVYPDGLVYLQYDQTLKSQGIRDLFTFSGKSFSKTIPVPPAILPAKAAEVQYATLNSTEDFALTPVKLNEIKFKTTSVKVTVSFNPANPASTAMEAQVTLPNFKLNGVPFQKRISPGASGTTFLLKDYIGVLTDNTFPLQIAIFEKPHNSSITIAGSTIATVKLDFTTIDFQYILGFFGDQMALTIPAETINFNAFGNSLSKAKVSFADPKLSFTVSNDYGIPTKVTFNTLEVRKSNGATTLNVLLNPASPINVNIPSQLGQSASTAVSVSNAKQVADFAPDQLYYKITARINEGLTSGNNFCADTSKIRVNFRAELPIYGKASDIVLADTFAIDLSSVKSSSIESGSILTKINNELPLDAFIQLYLTNDNTIIFDSLFTTAQTAIVKASTVNAQGELQAPGVVDQEIIIPKDKLDKIFLAKKIIVKAKINTTKDSNGTQPDVKFKSTYKMNVNFGLKAKLKLDYDL